MLLLAVAESKKAGKSNQFRNKVHVGHSALVSVPALAVLARKYKHPLEGGGGPPHLPADLSPSTRLRAAPCSPSVFHCPARSPLCSLLCMKVGPAPCQR